MRSEQKVERDFKQKIAVQRSRNQICLSALVIPVAAAAIFGRRLSREAHYVVRLRDSNGATRSHWPQNAVALALLARTACHRVMVSDGACATATSPTMNAPLAPTS